MAMNAVCHVEFVAPDFDKAKEFYGGLFGWTFQQWEGMDYLLYMGPEGGVNGGFFKPQPEQPVCSPLIYIEVDCIEEFLPRIANHGGEQVMGKTEIPGVGWFALVKDPAGNVIGLYEPRGQEA